MAKPGESSQIMKVENLPEASLDFNSQNLELYSKVISTNINGFSVYTDEMLAIETFSYLYMLCKKELPSIYGSWAFFLDDFAKLYNYKSHLTSFYDMELCKLFLHSEYLDGVNLKNIPTILINEKEMFLREGLPSVDTNRSLAFAFQKFGNILYELKEINFPFSSKTSTFINEHGDATVYSKANTLISEFAVFFNRLGKRIEIEFKPNLNLLENNYRLFDIINLEDLSKLRKSNLTKGYFYVATGLNDIFTARQEDFRIKVNDGCKAFNISRSVLRRNKYELKNKLETLNNFMPNNLKFNITEDKIVASSNHNYMLILSLENKRTISKAEIIHINNIRYQSYYRSKLYNVYVDYHININPNEPKLSFQDWISNNDIDKEYKMNAYIESQAVIYKQKFTKDSPEVIYEFLPEIAQSKDELHLKLKKDTALLKMSQIAIKNVAEFKKRLVPIDTYYKDKSLHYSIALFKRIHPEVVHVIINEGNEFFVLLKEPKEIKIP